MSAFVCSDKHISALVKWATLRNESLWFGNPSRKLGAGDEQELVNILYAQNVASVNFRYNENDTLEGAVYDPAAPNLSPVQVLKLAQSLDYQSCEHDGWEKSDAFKILENIKSLAINALPGYDAAAWSI